MTLTTVIADTRKALFPETWFPGNLASVKRSLGFVAVQPRNGTITIPIEARRALRLDEPGAQVEVILSDNDIALIPHLAVPLTQARDQQAGPAQEP